jgi:hypothetical protein
MHEPLQEMGLIIPIPPDGSFHIVIAHRDSVLSDWVDTEGHPFGLAFWRYMLPEGEIVTPEAEMVAFSDIASP